MASKTRKPRYRRYPLGRPWCEALELADGRRFILRPIQPSDRETLQRSFTRLTPEEVRFRFLHPITELTDEYAHRLTQLDPQREFALVIIEAVPPHEALIGAVARAAVDQSGRHAEFAIVVGREISGQGLAPLMLRKVLEWCRKKGLETVYGDVMGENHAMLKLAHCLGFEQEALPSERGVVRIRRRLRPPRD